MTDLELITLLIAIWGAGLSTILGIIEILNRRRKLKTANGIHYIAIPDGQHEAVYSLACVNDGERIIRLDSFGIELPNGLNIGFRDQHPEPQPFPITLNDGGVFGVLAYGRQLIPLFRAANYTNEFKARDYFFRAQTETYIDFSTGRDIILNPEQDEGPLNYFMYPYAEINGKALDFIFQEYLKYTVTFKQDKS